MRTRSLLRYAVGMWCILALAGWPSARGEEPKADPQEHPLMPAIRWAKQIQTKIDSDIKDYTCTVVKQELINGKVMEPEHALLKLRHKPFSVYMRFLSPADEKDQEAMFVEGLNNGNMWAHAGSGLRALIGTISAPPTGPIPMEKNRYPITEIGFRNLTKRLIEVAENDSQYGECEVKFYKGATVAGVKATMIQVIHPVARKQFLFHEAQIFIDEELNIPIRYAAWTWPSKPGGEKELLEAYTYTNIKLNVGLTDADFDIKNPTYKFSK